MYERLILRVGVPDSIRASHFFWYPYLSNKAAKILRLKTCEGTYKHLPELISEPFHLNILFCDIVECQVIVIVEDGLISTSD